MALPQIPVTKFRRAYLSTIIIRTMSKCGISNVAAFQPLCGGMIGQIKIDEHVYTGEIETIAEAVCSVTNKEQFVKAISGISIIDDTWDWI